MSDTALHFIKRLNDLSNGLITGKQLQKKLRDYLNLEVSESSCNIIDTKLLAQILEEADFSQKYSINLKKTKD
jgi:hypothetical protein